MDLLWIHNTFFLPWHPIILGIMSSWSWDKDELSPSVGTVITEPAVTRDAFPGGGKPHGELRQQLSDLLPQLT
jgi:hypothetical protein